MFATITVGATTPFFWRWRCSPPRCCLRDLTLALRGVIPRANFHLLRMAFET